MADHGRVFASIWSDPDFRLLTMAPQWLYVALLSNPDRNLCGVVPFTPRRWQAGVQYVHLDEIGKAFDTLREARFLVHDEDTDEVLIRTYVKHDPPRNINMTVGMWRQWERISSRRLRAVVVEQLPAAVWLRAPLDVPREAHAMAGHGAET